MKLALDISNLKKAFADLGDSVKTDLDELPKLVRSEISTRTPIKTGRARRGWQSRGNLVENQVPYIGRLENGYSRQAPNGFVKQGISAALEKQKRGR